MYSGGAGRGAGRGDGIRWFPKGPDTEDLALIAFHPKEAQYWDSPSSTMLYAYGYVKAVLTGASPKGGETAKVSF